MGRKTDWLTYLNSLLLTIVGFFFLGIYGDIKNIDEKQRTMAEKSAAECATRAAIQAQLDRIETHFREVVRDIKASLEKIDDKLSTHVGAGKSALAPKEN